MEVIKEYNGILYRLSEDEDAYTVVGIGSSIEDDITIPTHIDTIPVVCIEWGAFENCTFKSITSTSITNIGSAAFKGCKMLTTVNIHNVNIIEDEVFYNCTSLTTVNISGATEIGMDTFCNCTSLSDINIVSCQLSTIEWGTFDNCQNLKNITLPKSVTNIDSYAFNKCKDLSITILSREISITDYTFKDSDNITVQYNGPGQGNVLISEL